MNGIKPELYFRLEGNLLDFGEINQFDDHTLYSIVKSLYALLLPYLIWMEYVFMYLILLPFWHIYNFVWVLRAIKDWSENIFDIQGRKKERNFFQASLNSIYLCYLSIFILSQYVAQIIIVSKNLFCWYTCAWTTKRISSYIHCLICLYQQMDQRICSYILGLKQYSNDAPAFICAMGLFPI